jgi:putative phage-type endonuclease
MNELPSLTNIIHSLSVPKQIQETDIDELRESVYLIIDDFISNNIVEYRYKDFTHRLFEHTYHILEVLHDNTNFLIELNLSELIDEGIYSYFEFYGVKRSETTKITTPKNKRHYSQILKNIKKKDTHEQGTIEWYQFRRNHITASSAWKALEQESTKNQIILDKCKPINTAKYSRVNITSAMHHGHKFEPLSVLIYEDLYDTKIGEYGCIENDDHPHLAASPDGINIKLDNPRYGRVLEIKNPTTREICGIPKKEYWVQMQMQMECLNLDECDFLETSFKEYKTEEEFLKDGKFNTTKDGKRKGIILCFNDGTKPIYEYVPLNINTYVEYETWRDNIIDTHSNLSWIKDTYWHLETISCVLVRRNKLWFNAIKHKLKEVWDIILKEREDGYEHRRPKKRAKKGPKLAITTPPLKPKIAPNTANFKIDTQTLKSFALEI